MMKCQYSAFGQYDRWVLTFADKLTSAYAEYKHGGTCDDASSEDQQPWSICIKDRADLQAAEERKEHIDGEDPSDGAFAIVLKLVLHQIMVEDTYGVPVAWSARAHFH